MTQVFSPRADQIVYFVLYGVLALVLLVPIAGVILNRSAYALGVGFAPLQPVKFSHAHHVGEVGLDCRYCHQGVETSADAGLPATEICMTCHAQIFPDAPELAPVRESFASGKPLVWRRVHNLPDFVFFNHAAHVNNGVGCVTCHGRIDTMPMVYQAEPLTMQWCLDCHRNPGPNLRPADAEYLMTWQPPADRARLARNLLAHYQIHTEAMTDCYVCHR